MRQRFPIRWRGSGFEPSVGWFETDGRTEVEGLLGCARKIIHQFGLPVTRPQKTAWYWLKTFEDNLAGTADGDIILGNTGNDRIIGGGGADLLSGNAGADTFVYKALTDSQPGAGRFDTISDFTHNSDKIDFSAILAILGNAALVTTPGTVAAIGISYYQVAPINRDRQCHGDSQSC
jgi:hypothetical protein